MAEIDKLTEKQVEDAVVQILDKWKSAPRVFFDERIKASPERVGDAIARMVDADQIRITGSEPAMVKLVVGDCDVCEDEVLSDDCYKVTVKAYGRDEADEYVVHSRCREFVVGGLD